MTPFSPFPHGKIHTECLEEGKPAKRVLWSGYRQWAPHTDGHQDEGHLSPVLHELDILVASVISERSVGQVSPAAFNVFLLTLYQEVNLISIRNWSKIHSEIMNIFQNNGLRKASFHLESY